MLGALAATRLLLGADAPAPHRDPLRVALAAVPGDDPQARGIARLQDSLRSPEAPPRLLERLGWELVARARSEDDPGYYEQAEAAARALASRSPSDAGARLLLGHVMLSRHRFAEAEALARELVRQRGLPADHGLLGDALLSQGELSGAARAYQAMMDLRPDSHAYARAAELRWQSGDLAGALAAMRIAARAVSPRNAESFAWTWAQLAWLQLRAGAVAEAERSCGAALAVHPDSAIAWRVRGLLLLAEDRSEEAVAALARSAERSPLPETLWALAEALDAAGRGEEARRVEARLVARGEGADARGLALYLLGSRRDPGRALRLLRRELGIRRDAVTLAGYALALARSGDPRAGWRVLQGAVADGAPPEARLQLHAGLVAQAAGHARRARAWLRAAAAHRQLLLPSERRVLDRALSSFPHDSKKDAKGGLS